MITKLPEGFQPPGSGTKFGAGVLGKTSHVAIACVGVWAIIAWRLDENLVTNGSLLIVGIVVTLFAAWWTRSSQNFAEKNPAQALLEGASLVDLRRAEMQAKGGQLIDSTAVEISPELIAEHRGDQDA